MKRITIKEIAEKAKVSVGTVDRVLHNRGEVAEKTKQRIQEIAKAGNYKTNVFARNLKLNKVFKIAVVIPGDNAYWDLQYKGISNGVAEFESQGLSVTYYRFDRLNNKTFNEIAQEAIEDNPDGIVMAPILREEARKITIQLNEKELPFVLVDSDLPEVGSLSFIGQDAFQSGFLAGKLLDYGQHVANHVMILTIPGSDQLNKTIQERISGFRSYYSVQHPKLEIENLHLSDESHYKRLLSVIDSNTEGVQLFVPFSKSYQVANRLKGKDKDRYRMVGYDLIEANKTYVEDGSIDFLIHQRPMVQGYRAIKTLYQHLIANQEVSKHQYMPIDLITKENIKYYEA